VNRINRSPLTRQVFSALLLLMLTPLAAAAAARYDVAYLWSGDVDAVHEHRKKVARILGPTVEKKLKVVRKAAEYGLIYHRNRDQQGAERVATAHTKLLQSRGLEPATAVRSQQWQVIGAGNGGSTVVATPKAADNSKAAPGAAAPKQPATSSVAENRRGSNAQQRLENEVEKYIKSLRRKGVISSDERTAWSVFDFTSGEKLVSINEDSPLQGASLVKTFFALAYFHKVQAGQLQYGSTAKTHMRRMIQHSNNRSSNWVLRQAGGPAAVNRLLRKHYPEIFKHTQIVEYIPENGRTYRNKASVHDYSRFLFAMWNDDLPYSSEIRRLMQLPGRDRLYTGTDELPRGTKVYNKTGSTAQLCGDMGILVVKSSNGKRYPYTLVGVIEKRNRARNYGAWIRSRGDVIRNISEIVYKGISQQHNLGAG
jgi:beta-lactamase class A